MKVIVLGSSHGGYEAVEELLNLHPDAEIQWYEKGDFISFLSCGMQLYLEGKVKDVNSVRYMTGEKMESRGVNVFSNTEITAIQPKEHQVTVKDLVSGEERVENYDKLIMNVWTNGSMKPEEALALASRILIEHFEILANLNEIADETGLMISKTEDPSQKALETSIDDLDLSVRAYNCLKRAGMTTVQDLTDKTENEMMKIRNLGKKSLKEVINKVKSLGLSFRDED